MINLDTQIDSVERNIKSYFIKGLSFDAFKNPKKKAWRITQWIIGIIKNILTEDHKVYKGFFPLDSEHLKEEWMEEFKLPDPIFIQKESSIRDVYAKKYLRRGNTKWYFTAIANIYGADCIVRSGREYIKDFGGFPDISLKDIRPSKVIVVSIFTQKKPDLPAKLPFRLESSSIAKKLSDIYKTICPVDCYVLTYEVGSTNTGDSITYEDDIDRAKANRIFIESDLGLFIKP